MALRYAAVLASNRNEHELLDDGDLHQRAVQAGLLHSLAIDRLRVFANRPLQRSGDFIFLGEVFRRSDNGFVEGGDIFVPRQGFNWVRSLTDAYWGTYVAITSRPWPAAFRDPSGQVPCLSCDMEDLHFIASDPQALYALSARTARVDWLSLKLHLTANELCRPETCLEGVTELRPGELLELRRPKQANTQIAWQPATGASADAVYTWHEFVADLKQVVESSIRVLGSRSPSIILGISGGLDSSVVAAGLNDHPGLKLMTLVAPKAAGDERAQARQLANHLGRPVEEIFYEISDIDLSKSADAHLARPRPILNRQASEAALRRQFSVDNNTAFFSGFGGDNIFGYLTSGAVLADLLFAKGPWGHPWRTLDDLARLTGDSYWTVAKAVGAVCLRRQRRKWPIDSRALTSCEEDGTYVEPLTHPWLSDRPHHPGKALHLEMVARTQNRLDGYDRNTGGPCVSPLLSQPVLDFCMRIPVWEWCRGGKNRAPIREAFQDVLPAEVIGRTTKGTPGGFSYQIFYERRGEIRDLLLGGNLAKYEIIDTSIIARETSADTITKGVLYHRILELVAAELWSRTWSK